MMRWRVCTARPGEHWQGRRFAVYDLSRDFFPLYLNSMDAPIGNPKKRESDEGQAGLSAFGNRIFAMPPWILEWNFESRLCVEV